MCPCASSVAGASIWRPFNGSSTPTCLVESSMTIYTNVAIFNLDIKAQKQSCHDGMHPVFVEMMLVTDCCEVSIVLVMLRAPNSQPLK
ncbi:hypothetical protein VFPPC_02159 [Pochonia chlamydosporia 170]|uniref:Uncharacterized protein n=1 Tax=Pochonia chlamydosporia 170 TaxID=1380566 RepID=A0A179F6W9_METCM|nr:hypothetical protein VFPPC_02159 [Pochonia chlamydosporia 170]OAQ61152.1 hypothetical protein VFPPC_02159 [Pochonia chlamydosporia 170]